MSRRKAMKRARDAQGGFAIDNWFEGHNTTQRNLRARLRLRELQRHYREVGERVAAVLSPEQSYETKMTGRLDASDASEELRTDLLDLRATKAAIREMSAELGIDWLAVDTDPEEVMRVMGEMLEGSRRTGGRGQ